VKHGFCWSALFTSFLRIVQWAKVKKLAPT
jgi:hypothetical protein